jgi:hypothetical protein
MLADAHCAYLCIRLESLGNLLDARIALNNPVSLLLDVLAVSPFPVFPPCRRSESLRGWP